MLPNNIKSLYASYKELPLGGTPNQVARKIRANNELYSLVTDTLMSYRGDAANKWAELGELQEITEALKLDKQITSDLLGAVRDEDMQYLTSGDMTQEKDNVTLLLNNGYPTGSLLTNADRELSSHLGFNSDPGILEEVHSIASKIARRVVRSQLNEIDTYEQYSEGELSNTAGVIWIGDKRLVCDSCTSPDLENIGYKIYKCNSCGATTSTPVKISMGSNPNGIQIGYNVDDKNGNIGKIVDIDPNPTFTPSAIVQWNDGTLSKEKLTDILYWETIDKQSILEIQWKCNNCSNVWWEAEAPMDSHRWPLCPECNSDDVIDIDDRDTDLGPNEASGLKGSHVSLIDTGEKGIVLEWNPFDDIVSVEISYDGGTKIVDTNYDNIKKEAGAFDNIPPGEAITTNDAIKELEELRRQYESSDMTSDIAMAIGRRFHALTRQYVNQGLVIHNEDGSIDPVLSGAQSGPDHHAIRDVSIIDARTDLDFREDEGGQYVTLCNRHNEFVQHETEDLAKDHSLTPSGWCESCQDEKYGDPIEPGTAAIDDIAPDPPMPMQVPDDYIEGADLNEGDRVINQVTHEPAEILSTDDDGGVIVDYDAGNGPTGEEPNALVDEDDYNQPPGIETQSSFDLTDRSPFIDDNKKSNSGTMLVESEVQPTGPFSNNVLGID